MAARRRRASVDVDDPVFRRGYYEDLEAWEKRVEKAKQGLFKFKGRWMTNAERVARILKEPVMKGAVMEPHERPLLAGGKSFVRVTIPGTSFEMLFLRQKDETYDDFVAQVRALMEK